MNSQNRFTTHWAVAIDTDAYAGNFERQMCAHITGLVGDCQVGEEFVSECPFGDDVIAHIPDEKGCHRPCAIGRSHGDAGMNSVLIFFNEEPNKKQRSIVKERSKSFMKTWESVYAEKKFMELKMTKILGYRLIQYEEVKTEHDIAD